MKELTCHMLLLIGKSNEKISRPPPLLGGLISHPETWEQSMKIPLLDRMHQRSKNGVAGPEPAKIRIRRLMKTTNFHLLSQWDPQILIQSRLQVFTNSLWISKPNKSWPLKIKWLIILTSNIATSNRHSHIKIIITIISISSPTWAWLEKIS